MNAVIHYGVVGLSAACGFHRERVTLHRDLVTCRACRVTLKFRNQWYRLRVMSQ